MQEVHLKNTFLRNLAACLLDKSIEISKKTPSGMRNKNGISCRFSYMAYRFKNLYALAVSEHSEI